MGFFGVSSATVGSAYLYTDSLFFFREPPLRFPMEVKLRWHTTEIWCYHIGRRLHVCEDDLKTTDSYRWCGRIKWSWSFDGGMRKKFKRFDFLVSISYPLVTVTAATIRSDSIVSTNWIESSIDVSVFFVNTVDTLSINRKILEIETYFCVSVSISSNRHRYTGRIATSMSILTDRDVRCLFFVVARCFGKQIEVVSHSYQ